MERRHLLWTDSSATVWNGGLPGAGDIGLITHTSMTRLSRTTVCILSCLGMADEAAAVLASNLQNSNPNFRFPVMWGPNYDWVPDQDHGSNLINTLQLMLLQFDDNKILLAPAWPDGWEVDFKLHAPQRTVIEGSIRNGRIENLKVTPAERSEDVINCLQ